MSESTTIFLGIETLAELQSSLTDALDLAVAAGAPLPLLERLGASVGLVGALAEMPKHELIPQVVARARRALVAWDEWQRNGRRKVAA
jgi:hypothetical protein